MVSTGSTFVVLASLLAAVDPFAPAEQGLEESRFRIEIPSVVLTDVPVSYVVITARTLAGEIDTSFNGRPLIQGIQLTVGDRDTALEPFQNGVLELRTNLAEGRKVYITGPEIVVDPESRGRGQISVSRTWRWLSILPPLLAVLLAVWLRNVILALFVAIWSGAVVLAYGNFFEGFVRTLDTFLLGELVQDAEQGHSHMLIILFTMFLGATVGVMSASGGTTALVSSMSRMTSTREHGQVVTWMMGFVVFFDDYANTLLVGSSMRPVTDRLKISREKLAFIVDSTAAPVAGLAVISTWVGVEISYIGDTYARLGMSGDVYSTFLASIPYRFYPLHLLVFVWLISYSGNDFGPMLKAEARALSRGELTRSGALGTPVVDEQPFDSPQRPLLRNALVPLVAMLALILVGLWWTGSEGLAAANHEAKQTHQALTPVNVWSILDHSSPNRVMFLSSFVASMMAVFMAVLSRSLPLRDSMDAWANGAKGMFFALVVLVLAWSVATVCNETNLNTAGFLVELAHGRLAVSWVPTLAFLLAAAVSFATGSSWSTMGLLMPLFISVTFSLLSDLNEADPHHHLMLATIGAILAGAIFGDHCSPISDTTVLSSAATGCDHIDHVSTQLPYALTVAGVALLLGYVPIGFGYSQPMILLPLGLVAMYLIVQFIGRPVEEYAKTMTMENNDGLPSATDLDLDLDEGLSDLTQSTTESTTADS